MKLHAQDRLHLDHDRYGKTRREALDRSPRLRRSLSPHRVGASRREVGLGQRVDTIERRDEDWHLRTGRNNNVDSRSHSYGQARKKPNFEELYHQNDHRQLSDLQQTRVVPEPRKFHAGDEVLDYEHDLRYRHDDLRIRKDKETIEGRWSVGSGQRMTDQKLLAMEESTAMGSYSSSLNMGSTSIYKDFLPSSQSLDVRSLDDERLKFRSHVVSDKSQVTESHEVEESRRFSSRNIGYLASSGFYSKEYERSSSGPFTSKSLESYQDGQYFQVSDDFPTRSHGDLMDRLDFKSYGKRTLVDSAIDLVGGERNFTPHQQSTNSPMREHMSYFYSKPEGTVNDSNEDPSRVMQKINQTHDYIDYGRAIVSDLGDFSRPKVANSSSLKLQNPENLFANHSTGIALNRYSLREQRVLDYPDIGLTSKTINHDGEYASTGSIHVEVGRRVTQDYEVSDINPSEYSKKLHERSDYGSEREVGSHYLKERLHRSSMSKCDGETYRNSERVQRMTEGVSAYKLRDQMPKRNYFEEDMNLLDHRISMPCEYTPDKVVDLYDSGEAWMDDDTSHRYTSRKAGFDHDKYRKSNKKYDRHNFHASDDSFSCERYLDHAQKFKNGPKYMKGNRRHGPSSWIKSQNVDLRNSLHRPLKIWKNTEEDNDYVHINDDGLSDDFIKPTESEPPEDSEEFKQMVHEAFLKCSKKLNMKPTVRKKYKEQGNAGSLYCIVCGIRSVFFPIS